MKKGFTLIELVISTAIFLLVITIAVGAFVTVNNLNQYVSRVRNSQQKLRVALEMVGRLSSQADRVLVTDSGNAIVLFNDSTDVTNNTTGEKFRIYLGSAGVSPGLYYRECYDTDSCDALKTTTDLVDVSASTDLLGGDFKLTSSSHFAEDFSQGFPFLNIQLYGASSTASTSPFYNDNLTVQTSIPLRNPL